MLSLEISAKYSPNRNTGFLQKSRAVQIGLFIFLTALWSPLWAESSGNRPSEDAGQFQVLLDRGLTAFVEERFSESIESFNEALKLRPGDKSVMKALKYSEEQLSKELSQKKRSYEKELDKARDFMQQKQYIIAWVALRSVLKQAPDFEPALKMKEKLGAKARQLIKKQGQESYQHWVYRGLAESVSDNPAGAVQDWRKALSLRPNDQVIELAIDEIKSDLPAAGLASTVDEQEPCDCDVSSAPAQVRLFEPLALPSARASTPPAVEEKKPEPPSQVQLEISSRSSEAFAKISSAPDASVPKEAPAVSQAQMLLKKKDYNGAIRILEKRIAQDSDDDEARELLKQAAEERFTASSGHYRSGLLAYAQGDFGGAIEEWKAALKIYPEHPSAKKVLLRAFFKHK